MTFFRLNNKSFLVSIIFTGPKCDDAHNSLRKHRAVFSIKKLYLTGSRNLFISFTFCSIFHNLYENFIKVSKGTTIGEHT